MTNKPVRIAFLGPKGSYSHIAAMKYADYYFDKHIIECSCKNFSDIFNLVEHRHAEYGVLPIENSTSGVIHEVCNLLINTQLILVEDITIPIQHCILVNHIASFQTIQIIYSHPQPILQCSNFLNNFLKWKIIFCESTAVAIQTVAYLNQPDLAALGSIQGGLVYGLQPVSLPKQIISNCYINNTRFIVLKNIQSSIMMNTTASKKIMLIISTDYKTEKAHLIAKILQFYNIKINFLKLYKLFHNKNLMINYLIQ